MQVKQHIAKGKNDQSFPIQPQGPQGSPNPTCKATQDAQRRKKQPSPFLNDQKRHSAKQHKRTNSQQYEQQLSNQQQLKQQDDLSGAYRSQGEDSGGYINNETILDEQKPFHNSSSKIVRQAIIELYLNVKIRSQEEIAQMTDDAMDKERAKLFEMDTLDIIDYIKQSVEILMHMRIEEFEVFKNNWATQEKLRKAQIQMEKDRLKSNKKQPKESKLFEKVRYELMTNQSSQASLHNNNNSRENDSVKLDKQAEGYEKLLIKLESDVRQHIRIEQQLKLHIEQVQQQMEDVFKQTTKKNTQYDDMEKKYDQLKQELLLKNQTYSSQHKRVQLMEQELGKLKTQHGKDIQQISHLQSTQNVHLKKQRDLQDRLQLLSKQLQDTKGNSFDHSNPDQMEANHAESSNSYNYGGQSPQQQIGALVSNKGPMKQGQMRRPPGNIMKPQSQNSTSVKSNQSYNLPGSEPQSATLQSFHHGKQQSQRNPSQASNFSNHSETHGSLNQTDYLKTGQARTHKIESEAKMPSIQHPLPSDMFTNPNSYVNDSVQNGNAHSSMGFAQNASNHSQPDASGVLPHKRAQSPDIIGMSQKMAKTNPAITHVRYEPGTVGGVHQKRVEQMPVIVQNSGLSSRMQNDSRSQQQRNKEMVNKQNRRNIQKAGGVDIGPRGGQNFSQRSSLGGTQATASQNASIQGIAQGQSVTKRENPSSVGRNKNIKTLGKNLINPSFPQSNNQQKIENFIHNMSMDDGAQQISRKISKIGRRSQTTHEQSHDDPTYHAPQAYDQNLLKAQQSILDPTSYHSQQNNAQPQIVNYQVINEQGLPTVADPGNAKYNNKIIINQQHYFTDSIKIYQNNNNSTQDQPNNVPKKSQQKQSNNNQQANGGNGLNGRHTSMHEYIQSGINGLNMGVGGFSQGNQMSQQNAFQDLINSSQKVSVKHMDKKMQQATTKGTKSSQVRDSRSGNFHAADGQIIFNNPEGKYLSSNPTEISNPSMGGSMKIQKNNSAKRQGGPGNRGSREQSRVQTHNTMQQQQRGGSGNTVSKRHVGTLNSSFNGTAIQMAESDQHFKKKAIKGEYESYLHEGDLLMQNNNAGVQMSNSQAAHKKSYSQASGAHIIGQNQIAFLPGGVPIMSKTNLKGEAGDYNLNRQNLNHTTLGIQSQNNSKQMINSRSKAASNSTTGVPSPDRKRKIQY